MKRLALVVVAAISLITPAGAVDFNSFVTNLDGSPTVGPDGKQMEVKLGVIIQNALLADYKDEQIAGEEKIKRFLLAKNIQEHRDYSMTTEEIVLVKKLVAKSYPPLITGQVWQAIDPGSVK